MFGFLDASADTQWVRVSPRREQIDMLTETPPVQVTLENTASGQHIVMNDSLFQLGFNFLNFWTSERIEYNQAYRLTAENFNGEKSWVTVMMPNELPSPKVVVFTTPGRPSEYYLFVDGSVHLADVQALWYVRIHAANFDAQRIFSFSYRNEAEKAEEFGGDYRIHLQPEEDLEKIKRTVFLPAGGKIDVIYRQIYVAASGSELDSNMFTMDDVTYALPGALRNINDGLGYVIGIDSKIIPFEGCRNEDGLYIPCHDEKPFWP